MEIKRFNIPKLPRSKYNISGNYSTKYLGGSTIVTNYNSDLYDGLDSTSIEKGLTANQGKILNGKITNLNDKFDVVNISHLSKSTFKSIAEASKWLVDNKDKYGYTLHKGIRLRFREYHRGKWLTYIYNQWGNDNFGDANNWVIENDCDVINVTATTLGCPKGIREAAQWLVNDKEKYGYNLHIGMALKFRDYYSGEWLTYLYRGSNSNWKDSNFINANNWTLHAKQSPLNVINNLTSTSVSDALAANQGKVLNEKITGLDNKIDGLDSKYLSKVHFDVADGIIVFNQGLMSNGNVSLGGFATNDNYGIGLYQSTKDEKHYVKSDFLVARDSTISDKVEVNTHITSNDYLSDKKGFRVYKDKDNHWNLDIDNANIRGRLDVETLQVEEAKYIGGKLYCTKAGMICNKVEDYPSRNVYRCYFKDKDTEGNEIHNQFFVRDLAFCQTFHNNKIRRWWRTVEAVGTNYIEVSKTNCESSSDVPEVGDNIVQLGSLSDKDRQGAVIIEPLEINIYRGIMGFNLPVPEISLNPKLSNIKGKFVNADTNEDLTTSLKNLDGAIKAEAEKIHYDKSGNITNINTSGLVIKEDFNSLYSQAVNKDDNVVKKAEISTFITDDEADAKIKAEASKIQYDNNGNITNIDKSGLVATSEFAGLFTSQLNAHNEVITSSKLGTYNFVNEGQMETAIGGVTEKLNYNSEGNLTNIDKSGLVATSDFSALFSENLSANDDLVTKSILSACNYVTNGEVDAKIEAEASKVHYDSSGNITNINKSGLVATSDFSGLFSTQLNAHNEIVTQSQIATFITEDEANNLISNAEISADRISLEGYTTINNKFKIDYDGNVSVDGKITSTEGKIGNFNITAKGLYNDASNDGEAELVIKNSIVGGTPEYLFSVQNIPHTAYCTIQARGGTVLDCSTEGGVAGNFESFSDTGYSLKTNNRCQLTGIHVEAKYMDQSNKKKITTMDDFIIFGFSVNTTLALPEPNTASGKVYYFKNLAATVSLTTSKIYDKNSYGYSGSISLAKGESAIVVSDGVKWFVI